MNNLKVQSESIRCSVLSSSLRPQGPQPTRLLHLWKSPGKNTAVGYHSLFHGIIPTQGIEPRVSCIGRWILYHLSHQGRSCGMNLKRNLKQDETHASQRGRREMLTCVFPEGGGAMSVGGTLDGGSEDLGVPLLPLQDTEPDPGGHLTPPAQKSPHAEGRAFNGWLQNLRDGRVVPTRAVMPNQEAGPCPGTLRAVPGRHGCWEMVFGADFSLGGGGALACPPASTHEKNLEHSYPSC